MNRRDFTASVKAAAFGQWPFILQQLASLTDRQVDTRTTSQGTECPLCGGVDRYSFKSADNGWWACRHCPSGGGDGFSLLMQFHDWQFAEAVDHVACLLGLDNKNPEQVRLLRQEAEARRRVHDQQRQSERDQEKARGIQCANRFWANSQPYHRHFYAEHKRFSPTLKNLCRQLDEWLLVPVYSPDGFLMNIQRFVQFMPSNGERWPRYFVKSAPVKGGWLEYGPDSYHILITEGIADADACYQLQQQSCRVICAFSAHQFPRIAELARSRYPDSELVLCPDRDETGLKYAYQAGQQVSGCSVAIPPDGFNDWSDFFLFHSQEVA